MIRTRKSFCVLLLLLGGCGFVPLHQKHDTPLSVKLTLKERDQYPFVEKEFYKHFSKKEGKKTYHVNLSVTDTQKQTIVSREKTTARLLRTYTFYYTITDDSGKKYDSDSFERSFPISIFAQSDISAFGTYTALKQQHHFILREMIVELANRIKTTCHD